MNGDIVIETLAASDWQRIAELVERYADFPLGGTDASLVVLASGSVQRRSRTLDHRHFRPVRPSHCDGFELLP